MKSKVLWCLVGVNAALALVYALPRLHDNSAMAQRIDRPSDYLLIPGRISGIDRGIVYILDTSNGRMSAVSYEDSTSTIEVMPPTDLNRTFQEGVAPRRARGR